MKRKVISYSNLPTRFPTQLTLLAYLLLDKFNVSQLIWGIVGTILVLLWIITIYYKLSEEYIELWSEKK